MILLKIFYFKIVGLLNIVILYKLYILVIEFYKRYINIDLFWYGEVVGGIFFFDFYVYVCVFNVFFFSFWYWIISWIFILNVIKFYIGLC